MSKRRKHMKCHYNCFVATEAVDWILNYLRVCPHFTGQQISRFQAINLLRKYLQTDVIERVDSRRTGQQFQDNKELYRFTRNANENLPFISSGNLQGLVSGNGVAAPPPTATADTSKSCDNQIPELINQMSLTEKSAAFKHVFFNRFVSFVPNVDDYLRRDDIMSLILMHNMTRISANGVVRLNDRSEDLPHWVVSAMKCLANCKRRLFAIRPKASGSDSCLPKYPGFENDVFGVVRDYFINIGIPLIPNQLYSLIIHIYDKYTNTGGQQTYATINARNTYGLKVRPIQIPTPTLLCCNKPQTTSTPIAGSGGPLPSPTTTVDLPPNHVYETAFMGENPVTKIVSIDELTNLFATSSRLKSCDSLCDKYAAAKCLAMRRASSPTPENRRFVDAIATIPRNRRHLLSPVGGDGTAYKSPIAASIYKTQFRSPDSSASSTHSAFGYHNFGFAMQSPAEDGQYMESKSVCSLSSIHLSPISHNNPNDNLSAQFSNNSSNKSDTIVNTNDEKLLEALRMTLFLMPSANRRHLHLLLRLLSKILQNKEIHFRFYDNISAKEYILRTFTRSILCAEKENIYNEIKAQKIVCLLLDNCKDMFKVPEDVVQGVDRLLVEKATKILLAENERNADQYCEKITAEEFELQRDVMSEYALADLLKSIMTDDRLTDRDKLKWIKQFKSYHPDVYDFLEIRGIFG
ncbi:unnamed protein product [Medioppia subpectinata]|uniref:DEP domain-containing protein n=1 Tax=Medioppia subpectinata TaxID=1979941 RepID=A0A7R9PTI2_9ACAR|nr:unnamed protein product [Medioppia subpectinata]CAG2100175.1 unnamed protein product [Medioppia subpectinata]